jgi:hypothetical protein
MTDICERLVVHCPTHEASDYLAAFVADHKQGDGSVRITLRLPMSRLADRRSITERPAIGTFFSLKAISDRYPTYSVTWLPKGDGPSPEFAGALAVETVARDDCFGLILSGRCAPLGAAGAKCNAGRRIAHVSPRAVLHAIANYVENAHAHNEAALAGHRPLTYLSVKSSQRRVDTGLITPLVQG